MRMKEYPKIDTLFKRDMSSKRKPIVPGAWSQDVFEYLAGNQWQFTEKVDGTNIRAAVTPYGVQFGGKTDAAQIPALLVAKLRERFDPQADRLREMFPDGGCLYGEGYGAKIQGGGGNYRPDQDFVLFDVKVGEWWLKRPDVEDVAAKLGLDVVPIIGTGTLYDAVTMAQRGFNSRWGSFVAEGIVARPAVELRTRNGERIITKIKHRDFDPSLATPPAAG